MPAFSIRPATPEDVPSLCALAIQVYLDTYATRGVRAGLARQALSDLSCDAFARSLAQSSRRVLVAAFDGEPGDALVGFAELELAPRPAPGLMLAGAELTRLYVQPAFQRAGVGAQLIAAAEGAAAQARLPSVWLTAWDGNHRALAFYANRGYIDEGGTIHQIEDQSVGNRVLQRLL